MLILKLVSAWLLQIRLFSVAAGVVAAWSGLHMVTRGSGRRERTGLQGGAAASLSHET